MKIVRDLKIAARLLSVENVDCRRTVDSTLEHFGGLCQSDANSALDDALMLRSGNG